MPLYKSIAVSEVTHVLIWKVTETEKELGAGLDLSDFSKNRLASMKSETHRCAFLAVRQLLAIAQYSDSDLTYADSGSPKLSDGVEISITHSYNFAAIIVSKHPVGIDIEKLRVKISGIAPKFISEKEKEYIAKSKNLVHSLTTVWSAKEAVYKMYNTPGLSLKNHIDIAPFEINSPYTKAAVTYINKVNFYNVDILNFDNFICVYVTSS